MNGLHRFTLSRMLLFVVGFCIFSFKINLGGAGTLIRPDDFLIVFAFVVLIYTGEVIRVPLSTGVKLYIAFLCVGVFSAIYNGLIGSVESGLALVYVFRLAQYLVFYYIGFYLTTRGRSVRGVINVYFYLLVIVVAAQTFHLLPNASGVSSSRAGGNTNGPYELAAVSAFLLCYLGYEQKSITKGISAITLIVLSVSRITFIGMLASLVSFTFRLSKRSLRMTVLTGIMVLLAGTSFLMLRLNGNLFADSSLQLFDRIDSAAEAGFTSTFAAIYPNAPSYTTSTEYLEGTFSHSCDQGVCDVSQDASSTIRIIRWAALIKSTLGSWPSIIFGLGPSFASSAVDGYYVRLFAETGVLGVVAFLASMFSLCYKRPPTEWAFREYIVILLITAAFIDIFTSYKAMILFWLWHGINQGQLAHKAAETVDETVGTKENP